MPPPTPKAGGRTAEGSTGGTSIEYTESPASMHVEDGKQRMMPSGRICSRVLLRDEQTLQENCRVHDRNSRKRRVKRLSRSRTVGLRRDDSTEFREWRHLSGEA
mmetsp:Transcript_37433/g.69235  ORF Transcript_37433/g.69235 Transcript_37433/m.69235 type:complete len:104 (+) Transcript_37433:374-685(+)